MESFIKEQQAQIVRELERIDGTRFRTDSWDRAEGGGGISCVMQEGNNFRESRRQHFSGLWNSTKSRHREDEGESQSIGPERRVVGILCIRSELGASP